MYLVYSIMPKIHYTRFPVDEEVANLLRTCCALVSDTANNKLAASHCNGIWFWKTTRHNGHNGLLSVPTCCGLVVYIADLSWTCYGEVSRQLVTDLLRGNWCNDFGLMVMYYYTNSY